MSQRSDAELVREYVEQGSQEAFARLVSRYVDLVYTAALRQVRDRHAAEDVAQAAFLVLARKARSLRSDTVLAAWLLSVTRFVARDWLKAQGRRARHEEAAARQRTREMDDAQSNHAAAPGDLERHSAAIDATLDDALAKLGIGGREAVVLRFFQDKSFKEVGEQLGISEEAARQRVFRSLERLREILGRRTGVRVPAEGLGLMLIAGAIRPAPEGLAVAITSSVMKGAAAAAGHAALAKGAITLMAWTKVKTAIVGAAALLLLGGAGATVVHYATRDRDEAVAIGSTPAPAPRNRGAPAPVYTWWGQPPTVATAYTGAPITGHVHTADGRPVSGARVVLSTKTRPAWAYVQNNPQANNGLAEGMTDTDGKFSVAPREQPKGVMVADSEGFGTGDASASGEINVVLRPWGHIEGIAKVGPKPVPNAMVQIAQFGTDAADNWNIIRQTQVRTDAQGHFSLDRAVPGRTHVGCQTRPNVYITHWQLFDIKSGETTVVAVGGTGRPIIGRVDQPVTGFGYRDVNVYSTRRFPAGQETESYQGIMNPDGTFRIDDIPAGTYTMQFQCGVSDPGSNFVETAALGSQNFTVPEMPGGRSDEPMDVGTVKITLTPRFLPGEDAPDISGKDVKGNAVKLSDFRGKLVLLHLWSPQREDQINELIGLKAVYDWFGDDGRVAFVGMYTDVGEAKGREWAARNGIEWTQAYTGNYSQDNPPKKLVTSPANLFVIDGQGKLVAKFMSAHDAFGAINRALEKGANP